MAVRPRAPSEGFAGAPERSAAISGGWSGPDSAEAENLPARAGQAIIAPVQLEILGTRRIVKLTGHFHGCGPGEQEPSTTVVLHLSGALDRHAFGVRPRRPFDWVVGREVWLEAEITLEPAS